MKNVIVTLLFISAFSFLRANPIDTLASDTLSIAEIIAHMDSIQNSFDFKTGKVALGDLATITVPDSFTFLDASNAQRLLSDVWDNPKDEEVLGMLVPANVYVTTSDCWGIVYSYEEDGHVKDDDAESINYDDLLEQMQTSINESNPDRMKAGYDAIKLIGWAQRPYYDKANHKLHWAKELQFGDDSLHTLNYNIRVLGRKGVLVMNAVAGMDQLSDVQQNIGQLLASTELNSGNRYEDYDASVDKVAEYGVGGLIAGTVLAKTGLLAKIGLILVKAWKVIAVAVVAAAGAVKKFFFGRKSEVG